MDRLTKKISTAIKAVDTLQAQYNRLREKREYLEDNTQRDNFLKEKMKQVHEQLKKKDEVLKELVKGVSKEVIEDAEMAALGMLDLGYADDYYTPQEEQQSQFKQEERERTAEVKECQAIGM